MQVNVDEQQEFMAEVGEFIKFTRDKYRIGAVYEIIGKRQLRRKILYDVRRPFKMLEGASYAENYEVPEFTYGTFGST